MSPREHAARLRALPPARDLRTAKLIVASDLARVLLVHERPAEFVRAAQDKALKNDIETGECPSFDEVG